MVSQLLRFFNKELTSLHQAALLLGAATFFSQILGLVRDRLLTSTVGAGRELDIYYAAFPVPDFLFIAVSSLASATVLLPLLIEQDAKKDTQAMGRFLGQVTFGFGGLLVVVCLCVFFLAPYIAPLVAPGFDTLAHKELVPVMRVLLLSPLFLGISNIFASMTQLHKRFYLSAIAPLFYNIGIIIGIVALYPHFGIQGIAIGVALGALLHMLVQSVSLLGSSVPLTWSLPSRAVLRSIIVLSFPRTLGLALQSCTFFVLIAIASFLSDGSLSIFRLAYNLQNVPLGIIGMSFSVAAFPMLATLYSEKNMDAFVRQVTDAAKQIIFWALPVTVLFVVLRAHIVRVILGSQAFDWDATRLTAAVLALFVVSITAQSLSQLFARGFYATGDTKTPLRVNAIGAGITLVAGILFQTLYRTSAQCADFFDALLRINGQGEVALLALGFTVGATCSSFLLWRRFKKQFFPGSEYFVWRTFIQSLVASLGLGSATYVSLQVFAPFFEQERFWGILGHGVVSGLIGLCVAIAILSFQKNPELASVVVAIKAKFWKQKHTPTIPTDLV